MTLNFGVVLPSTNSTAINDFASLAPPNTSFEYTHFSAEQPEPGTAGGFLQLLGNTRKAIRDAVAAASESKPDAVIVATSAETFWNGIAGNAEFEERLSELTELNITTGATACHAALTEIAAQRIALLTPYPRNAEREARVFFDEAGFDVVRVHDLQCRDAASIAETTQTELLDALALLDGPDIDAIVQVGTNLRCVEYGDVIAQNIATPVLAINAITLWHALRTNGDATPIAAGGVMLKEH